MRLCRLLMNALVLCCAASACAQPNVVLFMVDDWGWTDWEYDPVLNPTGSRLYETPNMLRLAQMGTNFTSGYTANAVCSPSRAAVMTGKDPARLRITDWITGGNHTHPTLADAQGWDMTLNNTEVTLAEALKADGYRTGFVGKWHLGTSGSSGANPLDHGFDVNIGGNHKGSPPGGYFAGGDGGWSAPNLTSGYGPSEYLTDVLSDASVAFIDSHMATTPNDPFFLFTSHYGVHTPIQAPAATTQYFQNKLNANGGPFNEHDNATYAAMVKHVDDALGDLLDKLEQAQVLDDTLILLVSDNGGLWAAQGDPTSNTPLREGKGSWYEGGLRTPFIVAQPGNPNAGQGVMNDSVVIGHDIYTTVLDITGVAGNAAHNAQTDGVSFKAALEANAHDRGATFWHYPHIADQDNNSPLVTGGTYVSSVRKGDWKLMFFYADRSYELYNLAEDLSETTDVFEANTITAELSQLLRDHLIAIDAQMPINKATGQPVALPDLVSDTTFDLVYAAQSGELTIDTDGNDLHGYVIDGSGFLEENHTPILAGTLTAIDTELAEASLTPVSGLLSLGNVLPANMSRAQMLAAIGPNARYVGDLGTPQVYFEVLYLAIPGDTDSDGDIDDSDLGTAFANYTGPLAPGTGGKTTAQGDTDGDGDIDDSDLGTAFVNYTGPLAPANVPEPASLALLAIAGLAGRTRPATGRLTPGGRM
ncbi:MAG: sulfatase [Phycisphaeraceae bacterium]